MIRTTRNCLAAMPAALMTLAGCATVDPEHDYQQVGEAVARATRQEEIYHPDLTEDVIAAKVDELLAGGIDDREAVHIALLNNPDLQAAFMDVGMARADVVQAGLLSNPSLGLTLALPAGGGLAKLEGGLGQNIAELWQIPHRQAAAGRSLDLAILRLARKAADLSAATKIAFYKALGAAQLHGIGQENVALARSLVDLARARQEAGAATELDVNLSGSLLIEAELAVESARLTAADQRRELARLLGLTAIADELELIGGLPAVPPQLPDPESLIALARVYCLDIRAAGEAVAAAEAELEAERRSIFGEIEVGLEFERDARQRQGGRDILADTARASIASGGLAAPDIQPRSERKVGTDFTIGPSLGLELPIFDQNQAQIAKAKYRYQQAVKEAEALQRAASQRVRSSVDRVLTAWKLAQMYSSRSVPLAQRNLDLSREAYRVGRSSFLAVLEAQRLFLESRSHAVEAAELAATAAAEMERTMCLPFDELVDRVLSEQSVTEKEEG